MRFDELLSILPTWFLPVATFAFGALWGSFLNVVIHRLPREMSVVRPASHCPACGKPVAGYDNVPILAYVWLRGRARCCGAKMSPRYVVVEMLGGLLSLAVFQGIVMKLGGATPVHHALAIYTANFALCLGLVAAAFIDAEHMFLPDRITLGGVVVGVLTASFRDMSLVEAIGGAAAGFLGVWFPFVFLYKGLLGRTGMGMGDAKLLALAGAWFGWQGAVFVLFAGALQGSLYALVTWLLGIKPKLPQAVQDDIAQLKKEAAAGDLEAQKLLDEDPLTEDEDDAFIITFLRRMVGLEEEGKKGAKPRAADDAKAGAGAGADAGADAGAGAGADADADADAGAGADAEETARARLPFGPFLILAILELLFAGTYVLDRWLPLLAPP